MRFPRLFYLFFPAFAFISAFKAQNLLQHFANPALYNLQDSSCFNLSGEWTGLELEFFENGQTLKGHYLQRFVLEQEGNKVSGKSYIRFGEEENYGVLNIRGLVQGQRFYFEEYNVESQHFSQPNTLWCLRTGELMIREQDSILWLEGNNYKGYADQYYFDCAGRVSLQLSKKTEALSRKAVQQPMQHADGLELRPNPAEHRVDIHFRLAEEQNVELSLFDLAGKKEALISRARFPAGEQVIRFDLSPFPAGVHLVRMLAGKTWLSAILVIAR